MELRTYLLLQTLMITFFMVMMYFVSLRVENIERRKFLDSLDNYSFDYNDYDKTEEKGIIKNQYIVVLNDNATFIDGIYRYFKNDKT